MRSVELFAGAGGLAIGIARAGFHHVAVIENDQKACETFRENQKRHERDVAGWNLIQTSAEDMDYRTIKHSIDVVTGGPPCQPFSQGGKHLGRKDARDMFPEAIRAVRDLMPKAFIFENVKGLITKVHAEYFAYLYLQLNYPEIDRHWNENWKSHRARLEKHHTGSKRAPTYKVVYQIVNAADYGVPQKRERVFIVGLRSDLGVEWSFPEPTHSLDALLVDQWISESYWKRHGLAGDRRVSVLPKLKPRIKRLEKSSKQIKTMAWKTVRDAISDLPKPGHNGDGEYKNHILVRGARSYAGHSGSPFDLPAKTVKAGDHGVGGGENALRNLNGSVRYFTIRELARLQTFPDDFVFQGSWGQVIRQLGNAVPVQLAQVIGNSVRSALAIKKKRST